MWQANIHQSDPDTLICRLSEDGVALSAERVMDLWICSAEFNTFYTSLLQNSPFEGFFWEVKPITAEKLGLPFEFALINSTVLPKIQADPSPFEEYFSEQAAVVSFQNLGGDATLIVPAPLVSDDNYAHLGKFIRHAPEKQIGEFWKLIGLELSSSISNHPTWLSTAGLGVHWLHVRIDSRPKYYQHMPYTKYK